MNIVLLEPEIPQNVGNISRTCAVTGAALHLIRPLGFSIDDKHLKRAGLDYWDMLDIFYYDSFEEFLEHKQGAGIYLATTKAQRIYTQVDYRAEDYLVFGKESAGLPEELLLRFPERAIRIPMRDEARSLNLSNAAAIVLYEALRQQSFAGLQTEGKLHRHSWPSAAES